MRARVRVLAATAPGLLPRLATSCGETKVTAFDPRTREYTGFGVGCWLPLGSAMGPRCACRGEAGVVRGGRGANGRGGHGSSCLRRIMFFCSGVFCQGFRRGKGFRSGCWLPLESAMGPRCACRGEAGVVRGGRGADGRGGHGSLVPSPHHVLLLWCLLLGLQEEQGL